MPHTGRKSEQPKDIIKQFADHWFFRILAIPAVTYMINNQNQMISDVAVLKNQVGDIRSAVADMRQDLRASRNSDVPFKSEDYSPKGFGSQTEVLPSLLRTAPRHAYSL